MTIRTTKRQLAGLTLAVAGCLGFFYSGGLSAEVKAEHRKQVEDVRKELAKVKSLVAKKDFDGAQKLLAESEEKLKQIAKEVAADDGDKQVAALLKQVEQQRQALGRKRGAGPAAGGAAGSGTGAFERDVAPILAARCLNCHAADNPRANLRLDTFSGLINGGDSGPIVVPKRSAESLLVQRLSATGDERMPKRGNPLTADEIKKIAAWIADGARFTGNNMAPIASLKAAGAASRDDSSPVTIGKATGKEKVSFTNDIAPFMVNLCVGCHSGTGRGVEEGGLSLETFEKLMRGGKSGRVVIPGNTKDSRLWHLVGEQYLPDGTPLKMPPGQAVITRANHGDLKTWLEEGAKFDGPDAKAPLRSLVLSDAEKRVKELAALSPEAFTRRRLDRAGELWKAAFRDDAPVQTENSAFLVVGNAAEPRLKQIADWADGDADRLRKVFKIKDSLIWRGRLIVFVFKDRFSYGEFTQTNENKGEIPSEVKGHARVTAGEDEAYVCLQDVGDSGAEDSPGAEAQLMALLAEALLQRSPNRVPDWAARGMGLTLAARNDPKNPYYKGLNAGAHAALRAVNSPDDLFANGKFAAADLAPVGYTLVSHMLKRRGESQFVQFLDQLRAGKTFDQALVAIYAVDAATLAHDYRDYVDRLPGAKVGAKKSKK